MALSNSIQPSFSIAVKAKQPFVDKSFFILGLFEGQLNNAVSLSYPRQMGKSFNLDMVINYLSETGVGSLFHGLQISEAKYEYFRQTHMQKFPVIQFSLHEIIQRDFESAKQNINAIITGQFEKFESLRGKNLARHERSLFDAILNGTATDQQFIKGIEFLCELLHSHHAPPVVIIDEADTPVFTALLYNYTEPMNDFLFSFYDSIVYPKNCRKVIFCGIQPIFSTLPFAMTTNIRPYTLQDEKFEDSFGFSGLEVLTLIGKHNSSESASYEEVLKWSGSYKIGKSEVYSPGSVMACLFNEFGGCELSRQASSETQTYFSKNLLQNEGLYPQLNFQLLVRNQTLAKKFIPVLSLQDIIYDEPAMWRYSMNSGLITVDKFPQVANQFTANIRLPGLEVATLIAQELQLLIAQGKLPDYESFVKLLHAGNTAAAQTYLLKYLEHAGKYLFGISGNFDVDRFADYVKKIFSGFEKDYNIKSSTQVWRNNLKITFYLEKEKPHLVLWFKMQPGLFENLEGWFKKSSFFTYGNVAIKFILEKYV